MKSAKREYENWVRLEPERELDGTRYAWKLVIRFDPDWQDIALTNGEFSVHIADDMAEHLATALERAAE